MLVAAPPLGAAEEEKCDGKRVDIQAKPGQQVIRGTEGPDVIRGATATRRIYGLGGRDTICGGEGDNQIAGGSGSDTMLGGASRDQFLADATDTVDGGGGKDYVTYQDSRVGIEVDLAKGVVQSVVLGDEGASGTVTGVENVIGTDLADELRGDRRDNGLNGKGGNDFVDGRAGEDRLLGGDGDRDEVSYGSAPASVKTFDNVQAPGLYGVVRSERDELVDFEVITGSDFDDNLRGSRFGDLLYGGDGDDRVRGLRGNDRLFGGPGNDIFAPGPDDDYVEGGGNRAVTGARQPGDLVNYRDAVLEGGETHMEICLDLAFCRNIPPNATGEGNDTLKEIESVRVMANASSFIYGSDGPNVLVGGKKSDHIEGFGGNDFLFGLSGSDALYGGDGDDYLEPGEEAEIADGGEGNDTCAGVHEDFRLDCERNTGGTPAGL